MHEEKPSPKEEKFEEAVVQSNGEPDWTAEDIKYFTEAAKDKDPMARMILADDPDIPEFIKDMLEKDENLYVRTVIARARAREQAKMLCAEELAQSDDRLGPLMAELGDIYLPLKAFEQLYVNGVSMGEPHYAEASLEIGTSNDWKGCMKLLDAILLPFSTECSCGLARIVRFSSDEQRNDFFRRLGLALQIGMLAKWANT